MLIWRIEDATGAGMYQSGIAARVEFDTGYSTAQHPLPNDDKGMCDKWERIARGRVGAYKFGFASLDQLCAWTMHPYFRQKLGFAGLILSAYKVPKRAVVIGDKQVAYLSAAATLLKQYSLTEVDQNEFKALHS